MKSSEVVMEILEAFDLTQTYRAAGELAGVDPKTVKHFGFSDIPHVKHRPVPRGS